MRLKQLIRIPFDLLLTILLALLLLIFAILPFKLASNIGGFTAKHLGKFFKASKIAKRNLESLSMYFPTSEHDRIIKGVWDNLGRMFAELAQYTLFSRSTISKYVKIQKSVLNIPKNSIVVSGHFGNFELPAPLSKILKLKLSLVYRPANNIFFDYLLCKLRLLNADTLIPKGNIAIKQMMEVLSKGKTLGMLIDQKTSQGDTLKFFGKEAKTTTLAAKLAIKYNVPLYLTIFRRYNKYFISIESVEIKFSKNESAETIMQRVNDELEKYVHRYPDQWFWVHRRWG